MSAVAGLSHVAYFFVALLLAWGGGARGFASLNDGPKGSVKLFIIVIVVMVSILTIVVVQKCEYRGICLPHLDVCLWDVYVCTLPWRRLPHEMHNNNVIDVALFTFSIVIFRSVFVRGEDESAGPSSRPPNQITDQPLDQPFNQIIGQILD